MDDTIGFADDSGIPALASLDDAPVHSTPIKGANVPLPSTKHMMKHLKTRSRLDDESLQSIRGSFDVRSSTKGHLSAPRGQGHGQNRGLDLHSRETISSKNKQNIRKENIGYQDLSNLDNLRPPLKDHPPSKAFHHEKANSPNQGQGYSERSSQGHNLPKESYNRDHRSGYNEDKYSMSSRGHRTGNVDNLQNEKYYKSLSERLKGTLLEKDSFDLELPDDCKNDDSSSPHNKHEYSSPIPTNYMRDIDYSTKKYESTMKDSERKQEYSPRESNSTDKVSKSESLKKTAESVGTGLYSKHSSSEGSDLFSKTSKEQKSDLRTKDKLADDRSKFTENAKPPLDNGRQPVSSPTPERKSFANRSLSKQNSSFSELENTTLHKQRQEIQLLMAELKDRDRELSDMVSSHQQQLVAWEQDRDRLATLDKKCLQYEEELRSKTSSLRNYVANLKSMKTRETETMAELAELRSTVKTLMAEKEKYRDENDNLKRTVSSLQSRIDDLNTKVSDQQKREEELLATIKLKEKDMSSATSQMRELSERLQALDLRCKESQDRGREVTRERNECKHRYETLQEDLRTLTGELEKKRKDAVRLSEENRSARQQLALLQKEAAMMERCKDEVIDSIRVKQERTDAQLKNFRELYERQLKEVASLQLQLDTTKEAQHRRQINIDEQQLNSSFQGGRSSQMSEYSWERSTQSTGNQRVNQSSRNNKLSPVHQSRYSREPDYSQHTQSSGYQSQILENQTGHGAGNQTSNQASYRKNVRDGQQTGLKYHSQESHQIENQASTQERNQAGNQNKPQENMQTGFRNNSQGDNQSETGSQNSSSQPFCHENKAGNQHSKETRDQGNSCRNDIRDRLSFGEGRYFTSSQNYEQSRYPETSQSQSSVYSFKEHSKVSLSAITENESKRYSSEFERSRTKSGESVNENRLSEKMRRRMNSFDRSGSPDLRPSETELDHSSPKQFSLDPCKDTVTPPRRNGAQKPDFNLNLNSPVRQSDYVPEQRREEHRSTESSRKYQSNTPHISSAQYNHDSANYQKSMFSSSDVKQTLQDDSYSNEYSSRKSNLPLYQYKPKDSQHRQSNQESKLPPQSHECSENNKSIKFSISDDKSSSQNEPIVNTNFNRYQHEYQNPSDLEFKLPNEMEFNGKTQDRISENPESKAASQQQQKQNPDFKTQNRESRDHFPDTQTQNPDIQKQHLENDQKLNSPRPREENVRRSLDFEEEVEKQYTFDNKLYSFLEDLDDIDDSIWDEKPPSTINNISTTSNGESSPASKLRKLLIESQQMIQSLEQSTESPRHTQAPRSDNTKEKDCPRDEGISTNHKQNT